MTLDQEVTTIWNATPADMRGTVDGAKAIIHNRCGWDEMTPECKAALHKIADEIEGLQPVPSTFKGVKNSAVTGAQITLRMVVELIRERADERPDTSQPAKPEHLSELAQ